MNEAVATEDTHEELADELRALVDLVATHSFDADSLDAARRALASVRAGLEERGRVVPTSNGTAVPHWPTVRSAISGRLNPFAPPLVVSDEGDAVVGTMTYPRALQGPPEHAHGGHIAMVFDHLAGRIASRSGKPVVTGRLQVRYHLPTPVGREVRFTAKLRESRHSLVTVDCELQVDGARTASAEITFVELGASHFVRSFGLSGGN